MNSAYLLGGALALLAAFVHGAAGEATVVRKLRAASLPATRWGGGRATLRLVRASWHLVTLTFVAFATGLAVCGTRAGSVACDGAGTLIAGTFGAFALLTAGGAIARGRVVGLVKHPAPALLTAIALVTWAGVRT